MLCVPKWYWASVLSLGLMLLPSFPPSESGSLHLPKEVISQKFHLGSTTVHFGGPISPLLNICLLSTYSVPVLQDLLSMPSGFSGFSQEKSFFLPSHLELQLYLWEMLLVGALHSNFTFNHHLSGVRCNCVTIEPILNMSIQKQVSLNSRCNPLSDVGLTLHAVFCLYPASVLAVALTKKYWRWASRVGTMGFWEERVRGGYSGWGVGGPVGVSTWGGGGVDCEQ